MTRWKKFASEWITLMRGAELFLGIFLLKDHPPERIEDAYDLKVYTDRLESKRETVGFEDSGRECGFFEKESFQ